MLTLTVNLYIVLDTDLVIVSPSPSCPYWLLPNVYTSPFCSNATEMYMDNYEYEIYKYHINRIKNPSKSAQ